MDLKSDQAILVQVRLPGSLADHEDPLAELRALAESAGVRVIGELIQNRDTPRGKTYLGKGKVEELASMVKEMRASLVIFDNELAPNQIQELEKELGEAGGKDAQTKIIDRSELILDIFAHRATTKQAQLQVEIAQLEYTAPRLRAMWSHLGQVTGGAPVGVGTRGPGEQQLETDRRLVQKRLLQLERDLADVQARKSREVEERRERHFTAGLVGYTNAGKSSLFNTLTAGGAFANDQLFATLLTRVEAWDLGRLAGDDGAQSSAGGGNTAMLSDTVGFIRDLPHHLVASFRSTLEDAIHAHVLLIVLDVADRQAPQQLATVRTVLDEIGANTQPRILLLNKLDRFREMSRDEQEGRRSPEEWLRDEPDAIAVSALTGEGLDTLRQRVLGLMIGELRECTLSVPVAQGRAIDIIERKLVILDRGWDGDRATYRVRIGRRQAEALAGAPGLLIDGGNPGAAIAALFKVEASRPERRVPPHERFVGDAP
ncbi:MAG: GTPase HflX [Phycisphaerae bacterium]|nr:GTPase HflX [Phycisphaerae bacterium]